MLTHLWRPLIGVIATLPAQVLVIGVGFNADWRGDAWVLPMSLLLATHGALLLLGFVAAECKPRLCQWPPLAVLLLYLAMLVTLSPLSLLLGSPLFPREADWLRVSLLYMGAALPAVALVHLPALRRSPLRVGTSLARLPRSAVLWLAVLIGLGNGFAQHDFNAAGKSARLFWRTLITRDTTHYPYLLRPVVNGLIFPEPTQVIAHPSLADRFYVLGRGGKVYLVRPEGDPVVQTALVVTDPKEEIEGEMGMVGIAMHPSLHSDASRPWVFLTFTGVVEGRLTNRVVRFDMDPSTGFLEPDSERVLIDQKDEHPMHNGGGLVFGTDGFLYIGVGDGGGPFGTNNAQRIDGGLFSGVLRIDVDCRGGISHPIVRQPVAGRTQGYCIPNDNPFVGQSEALEEFWSIGLRNPFRLSLEPTTGEVWVADVGGHRYEEINIVGRGTNHWWRLKEGHAWLREKLRGTVPEHGVPTEPLYAYPHLNLRTCVIGGTHYYGDKHPELRGGYIFTDCTSGEVFVLRREADGGIRVEPIARVENIAGRGIVSVDQVGEDIVLTRKGDTEKPSGQILTLERRGEGEQESHEAPLTAGATFMALCARCHGEAGKPSAAMLPAPADFTSIGWQERTTDEQMLIVIRNGGVASGLSSAMPPWVGVLSDEQLRNLVPYIRSMGAR